MLVGGMFGKSLDRYVSIQTCKLYNSGVDGLLERKQRTLGHEWS